jgi:hypothetical protein
MAWNTSIHDRVLHPNLSDFAALTALGKSLAFDVFINELRTLLSLIL